MFEFGVNSWDLKEFENKKNQNRLRAESSPQADHEWAACGLASPRLGITYPSVPAWAWGTCRTEAAAQSTGRYRR
jgi:hypothetical protein